MLTQGESTQLLQIEKLILIESCALGASTKSMIVKENEIIDGCLAEGPELSSSALVLVN